MGSSLNIVLRLIPRLPASGVDYSVIDRRWHSVFFTPLADDSVDGVDLARLALLKILKHRRNDAKVLLHGNRYQQFRDLLFSFVGVVKELCDVLSLHRSKLYSAGMSNIDAFLHAFYSHLCGRLPAGYIAECSANDRSQAGICRIDQKLRPSCA